MSRILIIEDNELVANVYRNRFVTSDFEAETAADGETGLELMRTLKPDAVLLDLMLPGMNGVEVLKRIRAEEQFQKIPVVVFSNTYLTHMVQEAWQAGATRCLSKSGCTPGEVIGLFNTLLGKPAPPRAPLAEHTDTTYRPAAGTNETLKTRKEEMRLAMLARVQLRMGDLRTQLMALVKRERGASPLESITQLGNAARQVAEVSGVGGFRRIASVAEALEAFLGDLGAHPDEINSSTLRTVAGAADFLSVLVQREESGAVAAPRAVTMTAMVVDDDPICRRAVVQSLSKAGLTAVQAAESNAALEMLAGRDFDLILLDVGMPGGNGFELCGRLRALPRHGKTPVIFVTSLTDFESRAQSTLSGGNDMMAKPFLPLELALKALVWVFRGAMAA